MRKYGIFGAALCLAAGVAGCSGDDAAPPAANPFPPLSTVNTTYFDVTDEAGRWFDTRATIAGTNSLAVVPPGRKIRFLQTRSFNGPSRVESFHTVTSLIFPGASTASERIDQPTANKNDQEVTLNTPGLYVFVCKVHPYMLAGVIVDDPANPELEMGETLHLVGVTDPADSATAFPSNSNLALRLLRAFFIVTSPSNWKDYTKVGVPYKPTYPAVPVRLTGGAVVPDLNAALQATFDGDTIPAVKTPSIEGVGEVWVDTQYEESASKGSAYPSTITVVDAAGSNAWKVKRKIALPAQKMNNGHNMWSSHDQKQIYQTEWHGKSLYTIDSATGSLLKEIVVGQDPAHVMTRVDTEQVHVTLNGEDAVVELNKAPGSADITINPSRPGGLGRILMQNPGEPQSQPHAHWMGHDGHTMATPNSNSNDSTFFDFINDLIFKKPATGPLPIAAAMNPNSTKYYVSNYLGHSISVIRMSDGVKIKDINLLQNYNPISGAVGGNGAIGGLPIQTPVSPDGKFVITGNTLTGTITIIDAQTDTLVKSLTCDPGCHGVNFGAKEGGGYYAYVTSKFSNRLIVLDYDPNNDGNVADATIAGWVVLDDSAAPAPTDDVITGNKGYGGQGVLPVPNVYNGWVQKLPKSFCDQLTPEQRNPIGAPVPACL
jgi:DNA-binding beta-propeller fold protein YncE